MATQYLISAWLPVRLSFVLTTLFSFALPNSTIASNPSSISGQFLFGSSFGTPFNATYDYVIVGGGTAGLTLANRLSASGLHTVAVIEAGSFYEFSNSNLSQIPRYVWSGAGLDFADVNPLVDWGFKTEPEEGIGGKRIHYPRGKTLGGSSASNHMVYHRPTKGACKKWADEVGDKGYEWENWVKYFDRSTTFHAADTTKRFTNSTPDVDPAGARATSGPVSIAYTSYVLPISSWVLKATEALGMKRIPGFIDGTLIGSSWNVMAIDARTQTRESAETAYLRPALKRGNLVVHHSTMALKVLFEGKDAVGALCNTMGKEFVLKAKNEVIISAGAMQSPHLLMVSGIGPKETLQRFGIPVIVDAPGVGQGLEVSQMVDLVF
jgi:choline dehydrogenase